MSHVRTYMIFPSSIKYIFKYYIFQYFRSMDSPRTPKSTSLSAELKDLIDKRNMLTTRTRMKGMFKLLYIMQYLIHGPNTTCWHGIRMVIANAKAWCVLYWQRDFSQFWNKICIKYAIKVKVLRSPFEVGIYSLMSNKAKIPKLQVKIAKKITYITEFRNNAKNERQQ